MNDSMQAAPFSWDIFCEDHTRTLRENRIRLEFFLDFLDEARSQGIEMIPLKGMELLLRTYPSAGLRPMADIDLLIRPRDKGRIKALLQNRGFKRKLDFEALSYILPGTILYLDIIWDIWYLPDTRVVWERGVQTPAGDSHFFRGQVQKQGTGRNCTPYLSPVSEQSKKVTVTCLHPEDSFLYLLVYGVAHRGSVSEAWAQDLNFFLQAEGSGIHWQRWAKEVRRLKLAPAVFHGLSYAENHGLNGVPKEVYRELTPTTFKEKTLFAFYQKMVGEQGIPRVSYVFTWLEYPGFRGKLKLLQQKFFPSRFQFELRFGDSSWFRYFGFLFLRPFGIFFRGVTLFFRDLRLFVGRA